MNSATRPDLAVILAAGMGTRLGERGRARPKGFLELGTRPIIEESLERLREADVEHVLIVTGHCASWYEDLAAESAGFVSTVHNPIYSESGSMYSLYCARDRIDGGFLLLESDIVYERRALSELLECASENAILLSGFTESGDEVFVELSDHRLSNMSKNREQLRSVSGELVGISKISSALFENMLQVATAAFAKNRHSIHYETDCLVQTAKQYPVYCHLVEDLLWAEIDDEDHLRRARTDIYPAILSRDVVQS